MKKACLLAAGALLAVAASGCSTEVSTVDCFDDRDCLADEFCTVDGFCAPLGCVDDIDCPVGSFCAADGACVVDNTYEACVDTLDCTDPLDECWEVDLPAEATFGNFCSNECAADVDCDSVGAFAGVCYAIEADPVFLCYQQCDFDSDCSLGSVCVEVAVSASVVDFICVPDN